MQGIRKWAEDSGAKAGDEMALKRRDGQVWVRRIAAPPERTPSAGKRKRDEQEGLPGRGGKHNQRLQSGSNDSELEVGGSPTVAPALL